MKGGSIYPQGNRWIYKGFNYIENGKKKRDRKSFATEEEAQHYRDCIIRDLNLKVKREQPKLTIAEVYKKWQLITWQNEDYYTYNTQRGYQSVFNKHILPYVGQNYVENLDSHNLYMHLKAEAEEGKSQKTINNIVQTLQVLLNFAEKMNGL